jgi:cell division GTPase FtsZ
LKMKMSRREFPLVIAVGGGGNNALNRLAQECPAESGGEAGNPDPWYGLAPVDFSVRSHGFKAPKAIAINTDSRGLDCSLALRKMLIGWQTCRGLGAGGNPEVARKAARESREELSAIHYETRVVLLLAGLGGGTGSGATSIIAEVARAAGAMVIALVTLPFTFEGRRRAVQAQDALEELRRTVDLVVVFANDSILKVVNPTTTTQEAFELIDEVFKTVYRTLGTLEQPASFAAIHSAISTSLDALGLEVDIYAQPRTTPAD